MASFAAVLSQPPPGCWFPYPSFFPPPVYIAPWPAYPPHMWYSSIIQIPRSKIRRRRVPAEASNKRRKIVENECASNTPSLRKASAEDVLQNLEIEFRRSERSVEDIIEDLEQKVESKPEDAKEAEDKIDDFVENVLWDVPVHSDAIAAYSEPE